MYLPHAAVRRPHDELLLRGHVGARVPRIAAVCQGEDHGEKKEGRSRKVHSGRDAAILRERDKPIYNFITRVREVPVWFGDTSVQPADIGWPTGNGKKVSCSQAQLGQATCLAVSVKTKLTSAEASGVIFGRSFGRNPSAENSRSSVLTEDSVMTEASVNNRSFGGF